MTPDAIPDAAVEAAAKVYRECLPRGMRGCWPEDMRAALRAALPHLVAERDARIKHLEEVVKAMLDAIRDSDEWAAVRMGRFALEKPHG